MRTICITARCVECDLLRSSSIGICRASSIFSLEMTPHKYEHGNLYVQTTEWTRSLQMALIMCILYRREELVILCKITFYMLNNDDLEIFSEQITNVP